MRLARLVAPCALDALDSLMRPSGYPVISGFSVISLVSVFSVFSVFSANGSVRRLLHLSKVSAWTLGPGLLTRTGFVPRTELFLRCRPGHKALDRTPLASVATAYLSYLTNSRLRNYSSDRRLSKNWMLSVGVAYVLRCLR